MNALEILKATRQLLAGRERWTKLAYARSAKVGSTVEPRAPVLSSDAVCFCLSGAIHRVAGKKPGNWAPEHLELPSELLAPLGFVSEAALTTWNDLHIRTHDQVLARLDAAIAKLETSNKENGCGNG